MPNNKSAEKRVRQGEERRKRNKARSTELKTLRKKLLRAVHDGQKDEAETLYRRFSKRIDQASTGGFIHRNAADRTKSRLAKHINQLAAKS